MENFQHGLRRLIDDSDSEGAWFASTTDEHDSIASALTSLANQTYATTMNLLLFTKINNNV